MWKNLLSALSRLFRPTPKASTPKAPVRRMIVGVNVHVVSPADVAALTDMGVKHLRMSLYPDNDGRQRIEAATRAGFEVLVCSYRKRDDHPADRMAFQTAIWQYGNEPFDMKEAAEEGRGGDVSPGFANDTTAAEMAEYCARLDEPFQILAFHIYGDLLRDAAWNRLSDVLGLNRRLWVTEIGQINGGADDLTEAFTILDAAGVERCYVYALWSPDDGYTLTPQQRTAITAWNRGRA
jgi:hypothetical protein